MTKVGVVSYYSEDLGKYKSYIQQLDYIIAVDSGANALHRIGVTPDICIGDFDSINPQILSQMPRIMTLNTDKDETDTHVALKYVQQNIAHAEVVLFTSMSGRMDQQFGILALYYHFLHLKMDLKVMTEQGTIYMRLPGTYRFDSHGEQYFSCFAYADHVEGLSLIGSKYVLDNTTLLVGSDLGCSNTFVSSQLTVKFDSGTLLLYFIE